jgi:hypothetical protein
MNFSFFPFASAFARNRDNSFFLSFGVGDMIEERTELRSQAGDKKYEEQQQQCQQ